MNIIKTILAAGAAVCAVWTAIAASPQSAVFKISKRYLNIPVSAGSERARMHFVVDGQTERGFVVRLAEGSPDYWVFVDLQGLQGKTLNILYEGKAKGLSKIYQDNKINGEDSLYRESARPQYHFTTRRGWINDPNGLIWFGGEYHLFYQHNPYEREWENMHWGHAVSPDLVHWRELPAALYPDRLGTAFSGSAVIDRHNTAGFGSNAMVAIYTADSPDRQVQCLAYSADSGRTWAKYADNPVVDSKERWNSKDTRDPKVFWYAPGSHWVMVLNERDGHSIYTSPDLKNWTYQSHTNGFWECPDLFELPVDNNPAHTRWVMYGASGTYMIGSFDGKKFTPESGKHYYTRGALYAAQTFADVPDGRRIQMGWGRIVQPQAMPFNMMMLLPVELTLRTTPNGIRLYSAPVREVQMLQGKALVQGQGLSAQEASQLLSSLANTDCLRIKTTIKLSHATSAGLDLHGQRILDYDLNFNTINGVFYSPAEMTSMEITADIYLDKTSVEVFIDGGAYSYSMARAPNAEDGKGFNFWGNGIEVKSLEAYPIKSIWE